MDLKKDLAIIGGLLLVIVGLLVFGGGFTTIGHIPGSESTPSADNVGITTDLQALDGKTRVRSGSLDITAEIADTGELRNKGLANRESLPISEGMLFVFEQPGVYPFWMKDVEFPIDIIWISSDKKIVDMVLNAQPQLKKSDKDLRECCLLRPSGEALYVLEINAGLATANGLEIGDQVEFEL